MLGVGLVGCGGPKATTGTEEPKPAAAGVAATVNGEPISLEEYYQHTGTKQTAQVMTAKGASEVRVLGSFGLQALQELVDQKILLQMAKEAGALPTDADIDAELKFQVSLRPTYEAMLHDQGLSDKMIRDDLYVGLAREHVILKGVTVEPAEVDGFIKSNPQRFTEPAKVASLYIQVTSSGRRARVDADLAGGKSFGAVAEQFSESPHAKETGGVYPISSIAEMPKEFQAALASTKEKSTSDWITVGRTSTKFYVVKKSPAQYKAPNATQRELVRRGLALQKGQIKNDFDHKFFEKLTASKVDVQVPYLKEPWNKTWNQLSSPTAAPTPRK
jgi:parvulin-like peptidyl-prolyl isomerase